MNAVTSSRYGNPAQSANSLGERVVVVALVLFAHIAVLSVWLMQPERASVAVSEMSVSVAIRQAEVAQAQPKLLEPQQPRVERAENPAPKSPVREEVNAVPQPVAAPPAMPVSPPSQVAPPAVVAAPAQDTAPEYKAAYLNNPRPAYPMVARRMGWEGRVVLNVEVLAEGSCGAVSVFQSSGYEALDNAALRTVQGWHFVPASRAGHAVTQWFKVPIQFALKGNEA